VLREPQNRAPQFCVGGWVAVSVILPSGQSPQELLHDLIDQPHVGAPTKACELAHHFPSVAASGCAGSGNGRANGAFNLGARHLGWEIRVQNRELRFFLGDQLGASGLSELGDRVLVLVDEAAHDGYASLLVKRLTFRNCFVVKGGAELPDRVTADGIALADSLLQLGRERFF
jgi:hypothetical protein